MKLALVLFTALFATFSTAHAAITTDVGCETAGGITIYWESQPLWNEEDPQGSEEREGLYFGRIRISDGKTEVVFEPTHVLTETSSGARLAAWSDDGQYVIVNTIETKIQANDERASAGVVNLRIKKKKGVIEAGPGTRAKCSMFGEA
ncbi:MAG: hypothetical protein V4760_15095 [Bdellovibrionota bacterium]